MRNNLLITLCFLIVSMGFIGCSSNKAASTKDVFEVAKAMATTQEKADYLISQAKAFYSSKDFQGAVDIAQYILRYVDQNSQEAKSLLDKAKEALTAKTQEAVDSAASGIKEKIGSFGK